MKAILFSVFLLMCLTSFARLGETREQCEERYGKPVDTELDALSNRESFWYTAHGFYINIVYSDDGEAIAIKYRPKKGSFSSQQKNLILEVSRSGNYSLRETGRLAVVYEVPEVKYYLIIDSYLKNKLNKGIEMDVTDQMSTHLKGYIACCDREIITYSLKYNWAMRDKENSKKGL